MHRELLAQMTAAWIAGRYSIDRLASEFCQLFSDLCAAKRIKALTKS